MVSVSDTEMSKWCLSLIIHLILLTNVINSPEGKELVIFNAKRVTCGRKDTTGSSDFRTRQNDYKSWIWLEEFPIEVTFSLSVLKYVWS